MERSDAELPEGSRKSGQQSIDEVIAAFEHGDRGAYNLLVNMLKRSEPGAERALRGAFSDGDGLVAELVCQAYYPFVEALCKFKFSDKNPAEIKDLTSGILGDFVKEAAHLEPDATLKNLLYQRVCAKYKERVSRDSEIGGPEAGGGQAENPAVSASSEAQEQKSANNIEGSLPLPKRHSAADAERSKARTAALEATAAKAVAAAAAAASKTAADAEGADSLLPPLDVEKKNAQPKLKGFPSDSHEAKTTSPQSVKMIKALSRMSERDFATYQIIVMHYFGRKGYQQLCAEQRGCSLVDIGRTLCQGLLDLGLDVFEK